MLFILTGGIQTGKTRWLEALVADLGEKGVVCLGVISPGLWREGLGADGSATFEKLGIETLFLPSRKRAPFARRSELPRLDTVREGTAPATEGQSSRARLGWAISDEAIEAVNRHFDAPVPSATLLVVDELGRLELERDCGFTSAVRLLEAGPTEDLRHALIIVRDSLLSFALERFAGIWGGERVISPDDEARELLLSFPF